MLGIRHISLQGFLLCTVLILGHSFSAWGQLSFETTVNQNPVRYGQDVQLTLRLKNFRQSIEAPIISGLKLRSGPSTSQSNSWVNGKSSSEIAYTFTYAVVVQKDIQIPALKIIGTNGPITSKPFVLRVIAGNVKPEEIQRSNALGDLACVIEVSDADVFIGEPIVASFKIYNRASNLDVREYVVPEMPGFWKEVVGQADPNWEPQVIAGRRYNVANVRTVVLFPQQTGKIVLSGFELTGYMRTSFFDGKNVSAKSDPVTVQVRPLPEPLPANNIGTFKRLKVQTKASAKTAVTNEAIAVEITFNGEGNLKFIQEPKLNWPSEFEVFDPEVNDRINITEQGESGSRTFRYVVIPRSPGTYQIPTIEGTWFNYLKRTYQTLQFEGPSITIERNESVPESGMSYNSKTDVQVLSQDIRYIQTSFNSKCLQRSHWDGRNLSAAAFLSIGPILFGLSWFFRRRRDQIERDERGYRKKQARSKIRSELKVAKNLIHDEREFFPALGKGMESYLLAKLGWSASQNQREHLKSALEQHAVSSVDEWMDILERIDMARFAPGSAAPPQEMLTAASRLVDQTEKTWKA
ncbi:MAG: BatD family protein [Bacteroidetes bacterium]|nr:BatD family protein [Bacteroidota bacterium]